MDYSSGSALVNDVVNPDAVLVENESVIMDVAVAEYQHQRRASRSVQKNSESWARKRALMQRDYEWTMTLDREQATTTSKPHTEYQLLNSMNSLPSSILPRQLLTQTISQGNTSIPFRSISPNPMPNDLNRRRRSSRRLPDIPGENHILPMHSSNEDTITDDLTITPLSYSPTPYAHQPLRENSFSNRSTRSKSIDSESSLKSRSLHSKLSYTHQTQNAKSMDVSNLTRQKSFLIVNNSFLPQRSLDYPCIVRKAQDLSDIVRRRMLYSKINKQQQGNNFSISLEREHIPKVPRKIIIRQDNSIEIALR